MNGLLCGIIREKVRISSDSTPKVLHRTHSFGWHRVNKNYKIVRPKGLEYYYLIIFTTGGSGLINVNGTDYAAKENTVCLIPPSVPHLYKADPSWELYWLHITEGASSGLIDYIISKRGYMFSINDVKNVAEKIDWMLDTRKFGGEEDLFYSRVISEILHDLMEPAAMDSKSRYDNSEIIKDIIEYIDENYMKRITVEDISRHINMSPGHTIRYFKNQTGYTPYMYLKTYRLMRANQMLETSSYSIKQIAAMVGYSSPSHFISEFKAYKGITPSEYRK